MKNSSIKLAFAVNMSNDFESRHFGDADKYLIYEWIDNEFIFQMEEINHFKDLDKDITHGSQKKGNAIIDFLSGLNINVLVSKQFGKNIQMVNSHFIPVIVKENTVGEVIPILAKHIKWIVDEIGNNPDEYKLFTLKQGILKTMIKKES